MALTDLILVKPIITQTIAGVGNTTTHGVEQEQTIGTVLGGATATTTDAGAMKQAAFIAQATTFADLPAAVTAYNALLTALKNAGIMKPTA